MKTRYQLLVVLAGLILSAPVAHTGDRLSANAEQKASACDADASEYEHGALQYFHSQLCLLNVHFPAIAEEFLYNLIVKLGLNPDPTALSDDGAPVVLETKSLFEKVVSGTSQRLTPSSSFYGVYDTKAVLRINGIAEATLYWSGSAASSKGFLILGGRGFAGSRTRLLYLAWDRSTSTQTLSVLGSRFEASYLTSPTTDDALYGKLTYDTETKNTTIQMVRLGRQRGSSPSDSVFACWKMYAVGTAEGALRVGKTQDALASTGHDRTLASKDGIDEMDDWEGQDTKMEPDGTGNGTAVDGFSMDYSCANLNAAADSGKPFEGNAVDHDLTKSEMDTLFSNTP